MTERGFSDVAVESAHAFRAIMQAMARPGSIQQLDAAVMAPEPLFATGAAVALVLCDFQTPVWLSPTLCTPAVTRYMRFHAGAPIAGTVDQAHFVFASAADVLPHPAELLQGNHEYPDRSATLVIQVTGFVPATVEISGPGIQASERFGVAGLEAGFWQAMSENHARFPVGIDVIFAAPGRIAALPRSTSIRLLETA